MATTIDTRSRTRSRQPLSLPSKKATAAAHGPDAGWQAEFGDGVATFTSTSDAVFVFESSYYDIDGATGGGPGNWSSGLGFKFFYSSATHLIDLRGPNWWTPPMPTHITLAHLELEGVGQTGVSLNSNGIHQGSQATNDALMNTNWGPTDITIRYCYLHDFGEGQMAIQSNEASNYVVEYNHIARNRSTTVNHNEGWQDFGSDHMVVRYNFWESIQGTSVIALKRNAAQISEDWEVYGNLFYYPPGYTDGGVGMGVLGDARSDEQIADPYWQQFPCNNIRFYNNTMVRVPGWNSAVFLPTGTGNRAYNNLWFNCTRYTADAAGDGHPNAAFVGDIDRDYNLFIGSLTDGQTLSANDLVAASDPFLDSANADLRLTGATVAGQSLASTAPLSTYDVDMLGAPRGGDGVWDRGALEYGVLPQEAGAAGGSGGHAGKGAGGASNDAATDPPSSSDDAGCGCRIRPSEPLLLTGRWLAIVAALSVVRRRKQGWG
jgi:hypothetical protein